MNAFLRRIDILVPLKPLKKFPEILTSFPENGKFQNSKFLVPTYREETLGLLIS